MRRRLLVSWLQRRGWARLPVMMECANGCGFRSDRRPRVEAHADTCQPPSRQVRRAVERRRRRGRVVAIPARRPR